MSKPKLNSGVVIAVQAVVIAVLITAVVAFVAGIKYANNQNARVQAAVTAVETKK